MSSEPMVTELETGWLPSTSAADTYLRRFLLNWAGFCEESATSFGGPTSAAPSMYLADCRQPAAFANCATLMQPLEAGTAATRLAEIGVFFALDDRSRTSEALLLSAWPTGDLGPYGWSLMGYPPLHLLPRGATPPQPPAGLRIETVRDLDSLHAWERAAIEGFPLHGLEGSPPGAVAPPSWLQDPRRGMWVGWEGDRAVCAASTWTEYGINDVTLVATVPDARRRGYGEAISWRAAQADPELPAMLISSDDGRPIYERMGFLPLQRLTLWYVDRSSNRPNRTGEPASA